MNIKVSILVLGFFLISSCSLEESECATMCTTDFRFVTVQFKDSSGQPIVVSSYRAVNLRTGLLVPTPPPDTVNFKGIYLVASDSNLKHLSSTGDTIEVSAVNPKTDQEESAKFVVAGGECNCHISKLAGPQDIVFN